MQDLGTGPPHVTGHFDQLLLQRVCVLGQLVQAEGPVCPSCIQLGLHRLWEDKAEGQPLARWKATSSRTAWIAARLLHLQKVLTPNWRAISLCQPALWSNRSLTCTGTALLHEWFLSHLVCLLLYGSTWLMNAEWQQCRRRGRERERFRERERERDRKIQKVGVREEGSGLCSWYNTLTK